MFVSLCISFTATSATLSHFKPMYVENGKCSASETMIIEIFSLVINGEAMNMKDRDESEKNTKTNLSGSSRIANLTQQSNLMINHLSFGLLCF